MSRIFIGVSLLGLLGFLGFAGLFGFWHAKYFRLSALSFLTYLSYLNFARFFFTCPQVSLNEWGFLFGLSFIVSPVAVITMKGYPWVGFLGFCGLLGFLGLKVV